MGGDAIVGSKEEREIAANDIGKERPGRGFTDGLAKRHEFEAFEGCALELRTRPKGGEFLEEGFKLLGILERKAEDGDAAPMTDLGNDDSTLISDPAVLPETRREERDTKTLLHPADHPAKLDTEGIHDFDLFQEEVESNGALIKFVENQDKLTFGQNTSEPKDVRIRLSESRRSKEEGEKNEEKPGRSGHRGSFQR